VHHAVMKERKLSKECKMQTETVERLKKMVKEQ
jgi:hypothetical protein